MSEGGGPLTRKIAPALVLRRGSTCLLASVLVMPSPIVAAATGSWDAVRGLELGRRIQVVLKKTEIARKRDVVRGRFASATDDDVTVLASGGNSSTFRKDTIEQNRIRRPILNRKPPGFGCLIAGGLMGWVGGYLGGPAGVAIGFFETCGLSYLFLGRRGRTKAVYKAPTAADGSGQATVLPAGPRTAAMVRTGRLELPRVAPLEPKSSASTNSATFARGEQPTTHPEHSS